MAKKRKDTKDKLFAEVVEASMELHRRRLWTLSDSDNPILIHVEGEEHPLVAFVLGSEGQELGLSLLRGERSQEAYETCILRGPGFRGGLPCETVAMSFDPAGSIPEELLRPVQGSGLSFGKNSAVPTFATMETREPGAEPRGRPSSRPELRLVLAALRTLLLAASTGQLATQPFGRKRRSLELRMTGKGRKAAVTDAVVKWPELAVAREPESDLSPPQLGQRWYDVTRTAKKTRAVWGLGWIPAPPIEDDTALRDVLLVREESSGKMLSPGIFLRGNMDAFAEAFLNLLEENPKVDSEPVGLPKEIRFLEERYAEPMRAALDELGVKVTVSSDQVELEQAMDHLYESFRTQSDQDRDVTNIDSWKRWDQEVSELLVKAGMEASKLLKAAALKRFFTDADAGRDAVMMDLDESPRVAYMEWFFMAYRARKGARTVAETLMKQRNLRPEVREVLDARMQAKTIVARVTAVDPGASIELENCLTGKVEVVHDIGLSKTAKVGVGLIISLFPVREWTFASIAGPGLRSDRIAAAIERIESLGHVFENGILMGDQKGMGNLFLEPDPVPQLNNTDGDPLELLIVSFRVQPTLDVGTLLMSTPGVQDNEDGTWTLLDARPGDPRFENGVVIAHFSTVVDELHAHVNSANRAERIRQLFTKNEALTYLATGPVPAAEPGRSAPAATDIPPELQAQLTAMIHQQIMATLDEPAPIWGGKTPREAAKDPSMRSKVERSIRTYPDSEGPAGPIAAPREEMLKELGFNPPSL